MLPNDQPPNIPRRRKMSWCLFVSVLLCVVFILFEVSALSIFNQLFAKYINLKHRSMAIPLSSQEIKAMINQRESRFHLEQQDSKLMQDTENTTSVVQPLVSLIADLIISARDESSMFSQNGEDGVIATLFDQVGVTDKVYVEFGTENGVQTNTHRLRTHMGWTGLLMDGGYDIPSINLHREMIFDSNIVDLFQKYNVPMNFDLLSTDTDFKDFWISKAILDGGYRPRVIISEINSSFEKGLALTVPREIAQSRWSGSYYFGATPMAMTMLYREYGYSLVYCEIKGVNCFWIRNDELSQHDVVRFNERQHILDTIRCARYNANQGAHPTDLSSSNWWQEIVQNPGNKHIEIKRFQSSNKNLDQRRCA